MKTKCHAWAIRIVMVMIVAQMCLMSSLKAGDPGPKKGNIALKSLTSLAFNKEGVLFMADPLGGLIYAMETKSVSQSTPEKIDVTNIDEKLAALLGVSVKDIKIADMVVSPLSKEIFLAVVRGGSPSQSMVVKVNDKGKLQVVNLADVNYYETPLSDMPKAIKLPEEWHSLSMAITDMAFVDGELLVAGLSGEEFSSRLRRYTYPFTGQPKAVKLEIFHTSHDIYETHSPIETFLPFRINGQPHILAAYGCSPIAKFSLQDIRSSTSQLRGSTLAELGGGNRPLDMIAYKKDGKDYVLIANSDRTLMRMSSEDLDNGKPLTTVVPAAYVAAGVKYLSIAEVGIMQLDDFNDKYFVVVQRNINDGSLNLRSCEKWF